MPSRSTICPDKAIVRMPTTASTSVTNSPKLSADTTPKLCAPRSHSSTDAAIDASSPMMPSPPIGIRSPGERNASASIAAMPAKPDADDGNDG